MNYKRWSLPFYLILFVTLLSGCGHDWSDVHNLKGKVKIINETTRSNSSGEIFRERVIRLNEAGEVVTLNESFPLSNEIITYSYSYKDGELNEIEKREDGESVSKETSVKSSGGVFKISEETYNQNFGQDRGDESEGMFEVMGYRRSGILQRTYSRNWKGQPTKVFGEVTAGSGSYLSHTTTYNYNDKGDLAYMEMLTEKTDDTIEKTATSYEYDAYDSLGNWTSRKEHRGGRTRITTRVIYYYD